MLKDMTETLIDCPATRREHLFKKKVPLTQKLLCNMTKAKWNRLALDKTEGILADPLSEHFMGLGFGAHRCSSGSVYDAAEFLCGKVCRNAIRFSVTGTEVHSAADTNLTFAKTGFHCTCAHFSVSL